MIRIKVEYEAIVDDISRETCAEIHERSGEFFGADRPFAALSELHDNLMIEDRFDLRVSIADVQCEACPLTATQRVHGADLCTRCAREAKRTETQR